MKSTTSVVTASLVTYQTDREELTTVLRCLCSSPVGRIYIVDNSPDDGLGNLVGFHPSVEYSWGHGNIGYGAAHNIAIGKAIEARAKYHIVLNADIRFERGTIEKLIDYMEAHTGAGQVMPRVFYPNGDLQYLCKMIPTPLDLALKRFFPERLSEKTVHKFQLRFTGYDKEMNVPFLSGCFMFFRVSALNDVGLFDERFFMYGEDIDLSRRMHEKYRTMFFPGASIIHAHAAESRTSWKMLKIHIVNIIRYFNKWGWFYDPKRRIYNKLLIEKLNKGCE
jgi:GT2 family glycosyltransferase